MSKLIRWPGLIAFVVIVALLSGFAWLLADDLVKKGIEKTGTSMVGARVDVADVTLSLQPVGFIIHGMDIANPDQPMRNSISIERISLQVNLLRALMGQWIIDEADVSGLRFDTPRSSSGIVAEQKADKKPEEDKQPSFISQQLAGITGNLPDSKTVLERETLLVEQRSETLQSTYREKVASWESLQQQLPNQEKVSDYEQRLQAILGGKIKTLADYREREAALKQLKKDIRADQDTLEQARDHLSESQKVLGEQVRQLQKAPGQDIERITQKYGLDSGGLANMSALLFGDQAGNYLSKGLQWYDMARPFLAGKADDKKQPEKQRQKGRFIHFAEKQPLPDILVRRLTVSAVLESGRLEAGLYDITHQQSVINRPTTMKLLSETLDNVDRLDFNAVFDYRGSDDHSKAEWLLGGLAVRDYKVSGGNDFPLTLAAASMDMQGSLRIAAGKLDGRAESVFSNADFTAGGDSGLARIMADAIETVNRFTLDVDLQGKLKKPDIAIRSDLDRVLQSAVEKQLDARVAVFKADVEAKLEAQVSEALAKADLGELAASEEDVQQKIGRLDEMLEQKLDDYEEQQKQEAEDKAKDEVKKRLKELF